MPFHTPAYDDLVERINRFPQGAAPTEKLYEILKILFTEREAALVAQLPIKPFTARKAATIWQMHEDSARKILDDLCSRALILDVVKNGKTIYSIPPPMAGFFEFQLMAPRDDIDQQQVAELFYQYVTLEDDFMHQLFGNAHTQMGRVFVHEPVLAPDAHVLDYERATEVVKNANFRAVSTCYCRHKKERAAHACDAPREICMTFSTTARSLARHDHARQIDAAEGLDLLQQAYENNLVQFGENNRQGVNFICNCCNCCCEALNMARRLAPARPIHTTNFLPEIETENCNGCGKCVNVCPVEAMMLVSAHDPVKQKRKRAKVDADICLGCGVCARVCDKDGIDLVARAERVITPRTFAHRAVLMATERGTLADMLFDDRSKFSHRMMGTVLGAILKLPPVKHALVRAQLKSRYIDAMLSKAARN